MLSCSLPDVFQACVGAPVQGACNWLMRRLNRRSVVIIAMTVLMGLSVLIILYEVSALQLVSCMYSVCGEAASMRQAVPLVAAAYISFVQ